VPAHVLVVDDDPLTCELIREILCSAGMEAASLTDNTEAASRLRIDKFHAIFLGVRIPPPDGTELAWQSHALAPTPPW
jgi:DNA-binding response OmpR family regulator